MAVLPTASRAEISAVWQRENLLPLNLTKAQLRNAIDAVDAWLDDNSASFNTTLPVAARNGLSAKQKAGLLMYVINRRFEVS